MSRSGHALTVCRRSNPAGWVGDHLPRFSRSEQSRRLGPKATTSSSPLRHAGAEVEIRRHRCVGTAIATDKQALLPGQTATFANYTGYHRVTITWANNAIGNKNWLQVTVQENAATG